MQSKPLKKTKRRQVKKHYLVSLDDNHFFVVRSVSRENAIRLACNEINVSRSLSDAKAVRIYYNSTGNNPLPPGGDKPGGPGKAGHKNNGTTHRFHAIVPHSYGRYRKQQNDGTVKKLTYEEAKALLKKLE